MRTFLTRIFYAGIAVVVDRAFSNYLTEIRKCLVHITSARVEFLNEHVTMNWYSQQRGELALTSIAAMVFSGSLLQRLPCAPTYRQISCHFLNNHLSRIQSSAVEMGRSPEESKHLKCYHLCLEWKCSAANALASAILDRLYNDKGKISKQAPLTLTFSPTPSLTCCSDSWVCLRLQRCLVGTHSLTLNQIWTALQQKIYMSLCHFLQSLERTKRKPFLRLW